MKPVYVPARRMILIGALGLIVMACSPGKKQVSNQILGAGERFQAITTRSNDFEATSIYKSGTHGQSIWTEWDFDRDGKPDTTTFFFEGRNIASVHTSPSKAPGFDFSFYGKDGKVRTLWMARAGSDTFTDRITYVGGEARLERFVEGTWQSIVEHDHKRGIIANGQWVQLSYTNGSWTIVPLGQSTNDE